MPRIFNKIYAAVNGGFSKLTGCKAWLTNYAFESKKYNIENTAITTNGLMDALCFNKTAAILGGKVRYMLTASAPIDPTVL